MSETVVVVTGAAPLDPDAIAHLPADALVVAADGGLDHALAAGLAPAVLVGDLDSVSADGLAWAERHATVERHDPVKDATDTELALAVAAALAPARVVLVAGPGDRLDHTLAAIGALGARRLTAVPVLEGWWGAEHLHVLHGPGQLTLTTRPGGRLSLLALHGACSGVTIRGTDWELDRADLAPAAGHGVSNVAASDEVQVRLATGVLTIFTDPPAVTSTRSPKEHP